MASIGSLMIQGDLPRDEHGHPYQVLVENDEDNRAIELLRDKPGRPLTWVMIGDGTDHVRDPEGQDALRLAPSDVADAAEQWLSEEQSRGEHC